MAVLTDDQLMLVEQLTYFNSTGNMTTGMSIGELVDMYDKEGITGVESKYSKDQPYKEDPFMTDAQKRAIIEQLKANPEIMDLTLAANDKESASYCFVDSDGDANVVFRGTYGGVEWRDDGQGLGEPDTPCLQKALDFVNDLPYDNISVVGHSKGGNKAQYITLLSDKNVVNCVSMDGQGFPPEFIDKYSNEICERGGIIKNYSLSTDYVHILMLPVPGSHQIYIQGDPNEAGAKNHGSISYYKFDENGRIITDENGVPVLERVPENKGLTYAHNFTEFICNNMPKDQREKVGDYVGIILALAMTGYTVEIAGKVYTSKNLSEFIFSDQECLSTVIAYVIKYTEVNHLTLEELNALINAFLPPDVQAEILGKLADGARLVRAFPGGEEFLIGGTFTVAGLIMLLNSNLKDGKHDPIIEYILGLISGKVGYDVKGLYQAVEKQYTHLAVVNSGSTASTAIIPDDLNYTTAVRAAINDVLSYIANLSSSVDDWSSYSSEDWYNDIFIDNMIRGISGYTAKLNALCHDCQAMANTAFDLAQQADATGGEQMAEVTAHVQEVGMVASFMAAI